MDNKDAGWPGRTCFEKAARLMRVTTARKTRCNSASIESRMTPCGSKYIICSPFVGPMIDHGAAYKTPGELLPRSKDGSVDLRQTGFWPRQELQRKMCPILMTYQAGFKSARSCQVVHNSEAGAVLKAMRKYIHQGFRDALEDQEMNKKKIWISRGNIHKKSYRKERGLSEVPKARRAFFSAQ